MPIKNDLEFKQALSRLSIVEQRKLATQFVQSVAHLNTEPQIERALDVARDKKDSGTEFDEVYSSIKSLAVKTYTACGDDTNWLAQAAHFVATATRACLTPVSQLDNKNNLAWKCAMQARMAKNCEMVESESNIIDNEAQKQYAIANDYLEPTTGNFKQ